jgi:hypothetical protein
VAITADPMREDFNQILDISQVETPQPAKRAADLVCRFCGAQDGATCRPYQKLPSAHLQVLDNQHPKFGRFLLPSPKATEFADLRPQVISWHAILTAAELLLRDVRARTPAFTILTSSAFGASVLTNYGLEEFGCGCSRRRRMQDGLVSPMCYKGLACV